MLYEDLKPDWREALEQGDTEESRNRLYRETFANLDRIYSAFGYDFLMRYDVDVCRWKKDFRPEFDWIGKALSDLQNEAKQEAAAEKIEEENTGFKPKVWTLSELERLRSKLIVFMREELPYSRVYAGVCRGIAEQSRELIKGINDLYCAFLMWKRDDTGESPSAAYNRLFGEWRDEPCEVAYRLRKKYLFVAHNQSYLEEDMIKEAKLPRCSHGKTDEADAICSALDRICYFLAVAKYIIQWEIPLKENEKRITDFRDYYDSDYQPFVDDIGIGKKYRESAASRRGTPAERLEVLLLLCRQSLTAIPQYG